MQLGLGSILTQLPEEVQFLLSNKNEDNWFSILDKTDRTGEQLVALFKCIVKKQRIKPELVRELSEILAKKLDSNSLSKSAAAAYDEVQKTLQSRKRKADDAPENQPAPKKQTHDATTIEISKSTNLPVELVGIVSKYAEDIPFPWKFEDVSNISIYKNIHHKDINFNSCLYECEIFYKFAPTSTMGPSIVTISINVIKTSADKSLKSALEIRFFVPIQYKGVLLLLCNYLKKNNIPIGQQNFESLDITIRTKHEVEHFISILETIPKFPNNILNSIKNYVNIAFQEDTDPSKG